MSSVKNDPLAGLANLWNTTVKEGQRALDEAGELVTESINDVAKATEEGGFVGGAMQAFEEISPGNFAAGAADVLTGPGRLSPEVAATIRGTVNFAVGMAVPGAALPLQVSALVDASRVFGAIANSPMAGGTGQIPPGQTPERPGDAGERQMSPREQQEARAARRKAIEEAKQEAREQIREKAQSNRISALEDRVAHLEKLLGVTEGRPAGGYSPINDIGDVDGGFGRIDFDKLKPGRLKDNVDNANSEIDKILNNPNLSFEDMIFLLMSAIMRQQQTEIRDMTKELRGKKEKFEGTKAGLRANVDKAEKAVFDAQAKVNQKPNDEAAAKGLADARANLRAAEAELGDRTNEFNDSRAEQFELIKNAMQKLTEMQQALSNILNTMHQTAMNTIGNIR